MITFLIQLSLNKLDYQLKKQRKTYGNIIKNKKHGIIVQS